MKRKFLFVLIIFWVAFSVQADHFKYSLIPQHFDLTLFISS